MKRILFLLLAFTSFVIAPPDSTAQTRSRKHTSSKSEKKGGDQNRPSETLAQSANGWNYVKGEWVHPDGYKYINGKILRTTARPGTAFPKPPGKLALDNAQKLAPTTAPAPENKTAAEKAAETRQKNLAPRPASQTGTHL